MFAESRVYLSPEEPRDYSMNRLKAAPSLFLISDVNGNLVEYVLEVLIDTSKTPGNKPTNDSPILLKITPKAQWPLQRLITSDEIRYPIQPDNPLVSHGVHANNQVSVRKNSLNSYISSIDGSSPSSFNGGTFSLNNHSPNNFQ